MSMSQSEANKTISEKLAQAEKLITECEEIVRKSGVSFRWEVPTYGMGGSYYDDSWAASSQSC